MRASRPLLLTLSLTLLGLRPATAAVVHVAQGSVGGDGSCGRPFGNVAAGLAAARAAGEPSTLRLAAGTFHEADLRIDFSGLTILGGFDPAALAGTCTDDSVGASRDLSTFTTILDADLDTDGVGNGRILDVGPGVADITVDGVTFTHGLAGAGAPPPLPPRDASGGAMRIINSERVVVRSCLFVANSTGGQASAGGAIFAVGIPTSPTEAHGTTLTLEGNVFESNVAGDGDATSGEGGAVAAWDLNLAPGTRLTRVDATGNTFRANEAHGSGPLDTATWCRGFDGTATFTPNLDCAPRDGTAETCVARALGGAVSLQDVAGTWEANAFDANVSAAATTDAADGSGQGGALSSLSSLAPAPSAAPVLTNNVFSGNGAVAGPGSPLACGAFSGWGGALYLSNFSSRLVGNVFDSNVADATSRGTSSTQTGDGGAVAIVAQGGVLVSENEFHANSARSDRGGVFSGSGGGLYVQDGFNVGSPVITNNVFDSNQALGSDAATGYGGGLLLASGGAGVLLAGNRIEGNNARGTAATISGIGGAGWVQLTGGLIADNLVTGNNGTNVVTGGVFRFAGLTLIAARNGDPSIAPRVQGNLVYRNRGVGLAAVGFAADLDGDGFATDPDEIFFCAPQLHQNTLAWNDGPGLATNESDTMLVSDNVIWGNDRGLTGTGDWTDAFIGGVSLGVTVTHSDLGTWNPSVDATVRDPANANLLGIDPQFVDAPGSDFRLKQRPDQPTGAVSPLVDAGSATADARDYGGGLFDLRGDGSFGPYDVDARPGADTLADRTTRSVTGSPDSGVVDIGWHALLPPPAADTDGDGIGDDVEIAVGLDPLDADTDDDGLRDGDEALSDADADGLANALDCDSDDDALPDGLEDGVVAPDADTDVAAPCAGTGGAAYVADADPTTTTDELVADTDGDSCLDGAEDANHDGNVTAGETDPLAAGDCPVVAVFLRINEAVTSLSGGTAPCGPRTVPAISAQLDSAGPCLPADFSTGCPDPRVRATRTLPWTGAPIVLMGDGAPGPWALVFYEVEGCPGDLHVHRSGDDLVVSAP